MSPPRPQGIQQTLVHQRGQDPGIVIVSYLSKTILKLTLEQPHQTGGTQVKGPCGQHLSGSDDTLVHRVLCLNEVNVLPRFFRPLILDLAIQIALIGRPDTLRWLHHTGSIRDIIPDTSGT